MLCMCYLLGPQWPISSHCAAQILLLPRHSDQIASPSGSLPWFSHTTSLELNVYLSPTILQRHIGPNVVNSQLSSWTCLVVQWLRICQLMQETQVLSLIWEDPACSGATKPRCHSYYNPHLGLPPHSKRSHCDEPSTARKTQCNHRQISELST